MADENAGFFTRYTKLVPDDALAAMGAELDGTLALLQGVTEEQAGILHPPYTWTFRQVLGHLIDAERIFGYRALRIARADATPLPGFDENAYAVSGGYDRRPLAGHLAEFEALRRGHLLMFQDFLPEAWDRRGEVNGSLMSVRDLAKIIVGHQRHHVAILRERLAGVSGPSA